MPEVRSQGADISLSTTSTTLPNCSSRSLTLSFLPATVCSSRCATLAESESVSTFVCRSKSIYDFSASSSSSRDMSSIVSSSDSGSAMIVRRRGRPHAGSCMYVRRLSWTEGSRKLPCIVDTPRGGCAGIMSIPMTRPRGCVRDTATFRAY